MEGGRVSQCGGAGDAVPVALIGPLHRKKAGEQLADRLITAIALGEFSLGQRLPAERDLALQLQTSRTTVATALRLLAAAGYVEVRRGRLGGAYVLETWTDDTAATVRRTLAPRWQETELHQDYRRLVEGLVARTAAQRRDPQDCAALREALAAFERAETLEAARAADGGLHRAVAAATHNPHLVVLSSRLLAESTLGFAFEPFTDDVYARALPQHRELVEAVVTGDAEVAGELASRHFTLTTEALRALMSRAGTPGA